MKNALTISALTAERRQCCARLMVKHLRSRVVFFSPQRARDKAALTLSLILHLSAHQRHLYLEVLDTLGLNVKRIFGKNGDVCELADL